MRSRFKLPLIFVSLVVLCAWDVPQRMASTTLAATPDVEKSELTVLIAIQAEGFNPATMVIDQDTLVVVKNNDDVARWPTLAMSLGHSMQPVEAIPPGAAWVIRPMALGTWDLADRLSPSTSGQLTVRANKFPQYYIVRDSPKIPTGVNVADQLLAPFQTLPESITP